jgi:excisionase family DNA binding protein
MNLRTKEAAEVLNVAVSTLEAWRVRGGGPEYVKLGKAVRYSDDALEKFIQSRTRTSTSQNSGKSESVRC